ncbi:hypothetical protein BDZ94DRAFT_1173489 [Collybia nuda]|uniref:BTB domain-containing protein n=1 Tax=Collybia nuda TaxID=64659 RepID=A0A9P5XVS0_9AGAR|nr:hypothetical protein BDZ94DRAFT_1173489 [Collybia nuda]
MESPSIIVNASDADIVFKSADNVLFNIHRKNLEATTGAFPVFEASKQGQSVLLNESSTTLDLMFQYIYPMPQPDIPSLAFEALALLTEAVEKYRVFPAMLICKIHMQKFLPDHVQEIVGYAAKYGYNDIVAEAAPLLLVIPLEEALARLPVNLVVPWVRVIC